MEALRSGTVLFLASVAGGLSNCLFQVLMGRSLSVEHFGAMNALFALFFIAGAPAIAMTMELSREVSGLRLSGREERIPSLYRRKLAGMAALGALLFSLSVLFRGPVASYLALPDGTPVVVAGAALFAAFVLTVNLGMLQGLRRFYLFGAGMGLASPSKLAIGALLVAAGFGLTGALAGLALSLLLALLVTTVPLAAYLRPRQGHAASEGLAPALYCPVAAVSALAFAFLTNIDLIMVKHYLPPEEAGLYAAASVLGKSVLYLSMSMTGHFFQQARGNGGALGGLDRGLAIVAVLALASAPALVLAPGPALALVFGPGFSEAAPLLRLYGIAAALMSATFIAAGHGAARGRAGFLLPLLAACAVQPLLIASLRGSAAAVVVAVVATQLSLATIGVAVALKERRSFGAMGSKLEGVAGR